VGRCCMGVCSDRIERWWIRRGSAGRGAGTESRGD
jgi:hypothetical protein